MQNFSHSIDIPAGSAMVSTVSAPSGQDIAHALTEAGLPNFNALVCNQLAVYFACLMKWNKVMNLVGAKSWRAALLNLGADSFFLNEFLDGLPLTPEPEIWDLGAGAGLPGIPLCIIKRRGIYRMIEAREKRALFIGNVLAQLKLPGVFIHQCRVEVFFKNPPGAPQAQIILSRAFKPWHEVLELTRPHLAEEGFAIILSNGEEAKTAPSGWENSGQMIYDTPGGRRIFQAFKLCQETSDSQVLKV